MLVSLSVVGEEAALEVTHVRLSMAVPDEKTGLEKVSWREFWSWGWADKRWFRPHGTYGGVGGGVCICFFCVCSGRSVH